MILDEWIPGTPRPQGNPQQVTAKFKRYPTSTIVHRNEVIRRLSEVWTGDPIDVGVNLSATFRFQRPKSHYGTGRNARTLKATAPVDHIQTPDTDKLIRLVCDALTIAGVITDDCRIVLEVGEKEWTEGPAGTLIVVAIR